VFSLYIYVGLTYYLVSELSRLPSQSSDSDDYEQSIRSHNKRRKYKKDSSRSISSEMRFSTRNNKVMNYNEDEMDDFDLSDDEGIYVVNKSSKQSTVDSYVDGGTLQFTVIFRCLSYS
jgi:hypothetical protein